MTVAAYLINLDRSRDRLAAIAPQLDTLALPWQRIQAVDGRALGDPPWPEFDASFFARRWGKAPNPGAYGCYMSHYRAMQAFLDEGADIGLIVEDDAVLGPDLREAIDDAIGCRQQWDVAKLGGYHWGWPAKVADLGAGRCLVAFLQRQTGSVAYLLNRRAAKSYVAGLLPMRVPFDHELDKAWRYRMRVRGIRPFPISISGLPSTIGNGRSAPGARLGRLLYKSGNEVRRIGHYLITDRDWLRSTRRSARKNEKGAAANPRDGRDSDAV